MLWRQFLYVKQEREQTQGLAKKGGNFSMQVRSSRVSILPGEEPCTSPSSAAMTRSCWSPEELELLPGFSLQI